MWTTISKISVHIRYNNREKQHQEKIQYNDNQFNRSTLIETKHSAVHRNLENVIAGGNFSLHNVRAAKTIYYV